MLITPNKKRMMENTKVAMDKLHTALSERVRASLLDDKAGTGVTAMPTVGFIICTD